MHKSGPVINGVFSVVRLDFWLLQYYTRDMNRIREVADERNLTFGQVAQRAGVSVKTVYNASNGMKSNRSTRKLIARALRSQVDYLWPPAASVNRSSNN